MTQASPAGPQMVLFGGIEAALTGPRAKVKANALEVAKAQPAGTPAQANSAQRVAKAEFLIDIELLAATAVCSLDAKLDWGSLSGMEATNSADIVAPTIASPTEKQLSDITSESVKPMAMSNPTSAAPPVTHSISSPSQKPAGSSGSAPLTPSEAASLRKEMKMAMEWAEKELAKG